MYSVFVNQNENKVLSKVLKDVFMKKLVYADNAATTKLDDEAFEAMKPYLLNDYGNASQPYSFSRASKKALKNARQTIAECINAQPEEIYFTSGGTESDNWAIKGTFFLNNKCRIITSEIEHHAILNSTKAIESMGCEVVYLKPTKEGLITIDELSRAVTKQTNLVSVMFTNNEIGTIQPIKELAKIAHKSGALFHTDAVQAVGHIKLDVKDLDVDMLSASAHKFNGPKGIGFLYIKNGTPLIPYIDGGAQESSLRAGTENIASIVGMAYALKKNCDEIEKNTSKVKKLEKDLLDLLGVSHNKEIIKNGGNNTLPGIISLSFKNQNGEAMLHRLDLKGICVSTGSACDGKDSNISHVLKAIKLDEKYAKGTIRISLCKNNTKDEITIISEEIKKILQK